jgi:glyoxylase-like metal-dependent hydrolase (beta-lactamase superfamily II)
MRVADGVYRITTCYPELEKIPLYVPLVVGAEGVALVDAAIPVAVDRDIVPFLGRIGLSVGDLTHLVVTHGHPDHVGGMARLRSLNPSIQIVCSARDRSWVEDHGRMYNELFLRFPDELALPDDVRAYVVDELSGPDVSVTGTIAPGETIDLGGRTLRVLEAAGHSQGHVAVLEEATATLLVADASQGRGIGHCAASQALPPLYVGAASYRATQDRLGTLDASTLVSAHHDIVHGPAVRHFLAGSRAFVDRSEELVVSIVRSSRAPTTLGSVATALGARLCALEGEAYTGPLQLLCAAASHLEELSQAGAVSQTDDGAWTAA